MRGVIYGLIFAMAVNLTGCLAMKKAYVAIHDSIDEALTNGVTSVTNLVTTGKQTPAAGNVCKCDLSRPAISNLEDLRQVTLIDSHASECGLQEREGIPLRPVFRSNGAGLVLADAYYGKIKRVDGGYEIPCPVEFMGYKLHVTGYDLVNDHPEKAPVKFKQGDRVFVPKTDRTTSYFFFEARK